MNGPFAPSTKLIRTNHRNSIDLVPNLGSVRKARFKPTTVLAGKSNSTRRSLGRVTNPTEGMRRKTLSSCYEELNLSPDLNTPSKVFKLRNPTNNSASMHCSRPGKVGLMSVWIIRGRSLFSRALCRRWVALATWSGDSTHRSDHIPVHILSDLQVAGLNNPAPSPPNENDRQIIRLGAGVTLEELNGPEKKNCPKKLSLHRGKVSYGGGITARCGMGGEEGGHFFFFRNGSGLIVRARVTLPPPPCSSAILLIFALV